MALHPDDPPLARMNGVAKLFTHCDGYRRAGTACRIACMRSMPKRANEEAGCAEAA